jgi:UDP:flavonoid glycosyltransferase YjiC (YdhE family)
MRVLVATTAGAGHWGPLVPFARACADAGHEVRVAAPASFADAVHGAGFDHAPFGDADPAELGAVFGRIPTLTMRQADTLVVGEVFGRIDAEAALPGLRDLVDGWHPHVVVREPGEVASYVVAEERGLPHVLVNIGLDGLIDDMVDLLDEPLRELGRTDGAARCLEAPRWTVLPSSYDTRSRPGEPARFRGFGVEGEPRRLPDWWGGRDGPLVYVTFGSVAAGLGLFPHFYAATLKVLADLRVRVLMTLGEAGDPEAMGPLPRNVHVERWWPQADLMPYVDVVVGHGGFGTTVQAFASGVPQVVVPLFSSDQFANAARVAAVRAGVDVEVTDASDRVAGELVPAGPPVLDRLPGAVLKALNDVELRRGAQTLAAEMAALPPVSACVPLLEELAGVGPEPAAT